MQTNAYNKMYQLYGVICSNILQVYDIQRMHTHSYNNGYYEISNYNNKSNKNVVYYYNILYVNINVKIKKP